MAVIETSDPINHISGKLGGNSSGYFYTRNGKQFYRVREEGYQANQSPRQKWNSAAFSYAHKQLHAIEADAELTAQIQKEYETAHHKAPNGKSYSTAHAWKFNLLLYEWKNANPFEGNKR
ncbi:MAG: hypothetical protein IKX20_09970 [Paludibacteraceae bacterium]|nr:hypothetical protein [Paludibacteraceae bacterium]